MSDPVLPTTDIAWDVAQALLDLCRNLRPALAGVTVSEEDPGDTLKGQHVWLSSIVGGELDIDGFVGPDTTLPAREGFDITLDVGVFNLPKTRDAVPRCGDILGAIDQAVRADPTLGGLAGLSWILPAATPLRRWNKGPEGTHCYGQLTLTAETHLWIE